MLQWWIQSYKPSDETPNYLTIFSCAMACSHLHILQWMQQNGVLPLGPFPGEPMECRDAQVFYWLHERNIKPEFAIDVESAAMVGDLDYIQWLYDHKDEYPEVNYIKWATLSHEAAYAGHLNIIQWLLANRPDSLQMEHRPWMALLKAVV